MKWKKVKLSDISKPKQWKNLPGSKLLEKGFPVYGANGIIGYYSEYTHLKPTIAITCRGATCGNVHITKPKSYINSNAMALDEINESKYDLKFIYYALLFRGLKDTISGAAQPQITRTNLIRINLNIPVKLIDQKRIAKVLSNCENLMQKRKESIGLLDELLKSTFLEMFGDPVKNQNKWKVLPLSKISSQITDGEHTTPKRSDKGIKLLSARNIKNGYLDFSVKVDCVDEQEYKRLSKRCDPKKGDILMSCSGSVGRVTAIKIDERLSLVRSVALIKLDSKIINPLYMEFWMQTEYFQSKVRKRTKTSSQSNIFTGEIKKLPVQFPPIDLQDKFAHIVEKTENVKQYYKTHLEELENLYGSISQKAFKGELDLSKIVIDDVFEKEMFETAQQSLDKNILKEVQVDYKNNLTDLKEVDNILKRIIIKNFKKELFSIENIITLLKSENLEIDVNSIKSYLRNSMNNNTIKQEFSAEKKQVMFILKK